MRLTILLVLVCTISVFSYAQKAGSFNGLDMNLGNIYRLSDAKTRSISPENFTGEPGKGGMATLENGSAKDAGRDGLGWKLPFVVIKPGETFTMADIKGSGAIQHIWMTPTGNWRYSIFRIYWDDEANFWESPVGAFLEWAGTNMHISITCCECKSGKRIQLLLAHAFPQEMQDHHAEHQYQLVSTAGRLHAHHSS
jgi:hypothetical protein